MTPKLPEEQEVPEALILIYYRNPNVEQTWQLDLLSKSHQLGHFLANRGRLQIMGSGGAEKPSQNWKIRPGPKPYGFIIKQSSNRTRFSQTW